MNSTLLKALHKGLTTDQRAFYGETDSGRKMFFTTIPYEPTIPYEQVRLIYAAWDKNSFLTMDRTEAISYDSYFYPYLSIKSDESHLTYIGFYIPEKKTVFARWHFLSIMTSKDDRRVFLEESKRELDFAIMWVDDAIDAFNKECCDKLENELTDDGAYIVTDKVRKKIALAYREYLMGIAEGETAFSNICKRLGSSDRLFDANEVEFLDYCAQQKTLDDLLWSRMDHFKELHTKRCEYKRVSEQLLKDGEVITAEEQSFADAVKPIIDIHVRNCLAAGKTLIDIPVVIAFKNGLLLKTELLALRHKICDRCPLYYTDSNGYKNSIKDIKRVTVGQSLDDLGPVIWENNF